MFFLLSKTIGFFSIVSNTLVSIGLLGVLLLCTPWRRVGRVLVVLSIVLIAIAGFSPIGPILLLPLENRFPVWDASRGPPDGIVVLGGALDPELTQARRSVTLTDAAERITAAVELGLRYPQARIIFSSGTASLGGGLPEAPAAVKEFEALGLEHGRVVAEEQSRNTVENAAYSRVLADPKPGEKWLLVTSAFHMPRAIGAFRAAGFDIEAYPVDFHTFGWGDARRPFWTLSHGLAATDLAVHEWVGLIAYWLSGRTSELFPGPPAT
jgi:uncharacterized SAM-binding protein YcdF (DUF218 family)